MLRFHTQTAGCSLTAQQPYNNIVRVTIQALAAVFGGTQSLHTNSLDETLALPTEAAARIALRTQQIIAHESGVINTVDPLGGSFFIEELTNQMEKGCFDYIEKIDAFGGMVEAIEAGFPQREIWDASYQFQRSVDSGEKIVVGVNALQDGDRGSVRRPLHRRVGGRASRSRALNQVRATRDRAKVAGGAAGAAQRRRRSEREHDAVHHRRGEDLRHGRRDQRRAARRVRDVSGAGAVLKPLNHRDTKITENTLCPLCLCGETLLNRQPANPSRMSCTRERSWPCGRRSDVACTLSRIVCRSSLRRVAELRGDDVGDDLGFRVGEFDQIGEIAQQPLRRPALQIFDECLQFRECLRIDRLHHDRRRRHFLIPCFCHEHHLSRVFSVGRQIRQQHPRRAHPTITAEGRQCAAVTKRRDMIPARSCRSLDS